MEIKTYSKKKNLRYEIIGTLMVLAPTLGFICFTLFPMALSLYVSFNELHSYTISNMTWIGLANYKSIFTAPMVVTSIKNTLIFAICVPINLTTAVFLSNIMAKKLPGNRFMRILMFLPQVCSGVAVTMMWKWIFEDNFGAINTVLSSLGLGKVKWLSDVTPFTIAILIISLWQHGTNVIVLEASFGNINKTVQEAAEIDGANGFMVFWKVTWPSITPTVFYLLVTWLIVALQEQTVMQTITTNGVGPSNRALTLVYYIYRMAFVYTPTMGLGMACALSWVTAIVIMLISRLLFWSSKFWVKYDV